MALGSDKFYVLQGLINSTILVNKIASLPASSFGQSILFPQSIVLTNFAIPMEALFGNPF
jgi:hypothetical protein